MWASLHSTAATHLPVWGLQDFWVREGFGTRAFHNQTSFTAFGLVLLGVLGLSLLAAPRRYAAVPILILSSLVPPAQRIAVVGLDFSFLRILVLLGCLRLVVRGEHKYLRWQKVDKLILAWVLVAMTVFIVRRGGSAVVNRLGHAYDVLGLYFVLRCLVRDLKDIRILAIAAAWLALFSAPFFQRESNTGLNPFHALGAGEWSRVRDGEVRAKGPFLHPILAGSYWATLAPLIWMLWYQRGALKLLAVAGTLASLVIVLSSASSTPIMVFAAGFFAIGLVHARHHLGLIRMSALAGAVCLHLVMNRPVWHLISRVKVLGASTGYHRFKIIDGAIRNWDDWFLIGVNSTASWGIGMFDVTNEFVRIAINGGILSLVLFSWALALGFGRIGRAWRAYRGERSSLMIAWCVGACLFSQIAMFMAVSISYSQQNLFVLFLALAAGASLAQTAAQRSPARRPRVRPRTPRPRRLVHESATGAGAALRRRRLWPA